MKWVVVVVMLGICVGWLEVLRRRRARLDAPDRVAQLRALLRRPVLVNGRPHQPKPILSVEPSVKVTRFRQKIARRT